MRMVPSLRRLYEHLRKLPGIGSKTALRLSYHIIDLPPEQVKDLAEALIKAKSEIRTCQKCYNLADSDLCEVCRLPNRDFTTICVVEQPQDVAALERSQGYTGVYHVLHGVLSPLDGIGPDDLKLKELVQRAGSDDVKEVIVATNSNIEGEATAVYIAKLLKPLGINVSRIAHGLPIGSDLEYADELTLARALENRRLI